jgi:hypothetical protein
MADGQLLFALAKARPKARLDKVKNVLKFQPGGMRFIISCTAAKSMVQRTLVPIFGA